MFTIQVLFSSTVKAQCFDCEAEAREAFQEVRGKLKSPQYQGVTASLSDPVGVELDRA